MCKYYSTCSRCKYEIEVFAEQQNMNDVNVKIATDCPNVQPITKIPISLDAIYEMTVPKEKSKLYNLLSDQHLKEGCTLYDNVMNAIGKNLGRYYELA